MYTLLTGVVDNIWFISIKDKNIEIKTVGSV